MMLKTNSKKVGEGEKGRERSSRPFFFDDEREVPGEGNVVHERPIKKGEDTIAVITKTS